MAAQQRDLAGTGPASTQTRLPHAAVLDGMRGVAVLAVLLFHLGSAVGWAPPNEPLRGLFYSLGTFGVELFFILSAFLLFLPTVQHGSFGSRRTYAKRRAARIVPAYLLCLGVGLALRSLLLPAGAVSGPDARAVLAHLTFTQAEFLHKGQRGFGVDGAVWTLSIEALFYLVLPFIALAFARRPSWSLGLGAMVSLGWCLVSVSHQDRAQFPSFVFCFALGMYAAYAFARATPLTGPAILRTALVIADLTGLVVCADAIGRGANPGSILSAPTWTVIVVPLLLGALCLLVTEAPAAPVYWLLTNRPMRWISSRSYSLYLYQLLAMHFALQSLHVRADASLPALGRMIASAVPMTMIAAELSYRLAERPFQRWSRQAGGRRTATVASARPCPET